MGRMFIGALGALLLLGCNPDRGPRATGTALDLDLDISPTPLLFESLAPGFEDTRSVTIENNGTSPVKVLDLRLVGPENTFSLDEMEGEVELVEGESMEIEIGYRQVVGLPSGTLFVETTHGTFVVPIRTVLGPPRITANPESIEFGWLSIGEANNDEIRIVNEGGSTGNVSDVFVIGDPEFFLLDSGAQAPLSLQPGQAVRLWPAVRAEEPGERLADVILITDSGTLEVALYAHVRAPPCIEVTPRELAFGNLTVGAERTEAVTVTHCGEETDEPLNLEQLTIRDSNSAAFTLIAPPERTLAGGQSVELLVQYTPQRLEFTDTAVLRIVSDADGEPVIDVPLIGRGVEQACEGVVVALCTIEGLDVAPSADLHVIPLDTISCEMTVEGTCPAVTTSWALTSAPPDSTAIPVTAGDELSFFVDLAGVYTIEASALFADGPPATPATVRIEAVPDEDLHVQLVWDNASDVDLHLVHPNGCWESGRWDCHFRNRIPEWAAEGPSDNPSLDIDDTNGFGPENINLDQPELGTDYRVGVHYWSDHGQGPARATVRIFIRGELLFEASEILPSSGDWWEVAEIQWSTATVGPINRISGSTPSCD